MSQIAFRAKNMLESGAITPDTFAENGGVIDLGKIGGESPGPAVTAETVTKRPGLSRQHRERLPAKMAAQLMDYYMTPAALNNRHDFNPIRDGLPQCRNHVFDRANGKYGCIHSCGAKNPDTVLPTYMDHSVYDVFMWTTALIEKAYKGANFAKGWKQSFQTTE